MCVRNQTLYHYCLIISLLYLEEQYMITNGHNLLHMTGVVDNLGPSYF